MEDPLFIKQFVTSVRRQPLNTHYQVYASDSASAQGITWNIDSPFAGALLDNEVWVEFEVAFTGTAEADLTFINLFEGYTRLETPVDDGDFRGLPKVANTLAFRQGFPVTSALSNCEVVINGQSLRQNPQRWAHEFARFYAHPTELAGVATMSGGELDSGNHTLLTKDHASSNTGQAVALAVWDLTTMPINGFGHHYPGANDAGASPVKYNRMVRARGITSDDRWYNAGFGARRHRLMERWRETKAANVGPTSGNHPAPTVGVQFAETLKLKVYERLPISPFLLWEAKDKKRSIPYVDKMEISLQFIANAHKFIFQGSIADGDLSARLTYHNNAKIHLKWYIPPPGMAIPPELSIPVSVYKESVIAKTLSDVAPATKGPSTTSEVNYENLRLQQIPDLLFIYVKLAPSAVSMLESSEHHVEISSVEITLNGDSGKVLRANSAQLFSMYVRNSPMRAHRAMEYSEWQKYFCTLAFKPSDLGVRVPPGVNHGVTLDVRMTVANWWAIPRIGTNLGTGEQDNGVSVGTTNAATSFEIHVLGIYDKYELTLTNRGNAQLKLQNMPSLDLPQSLAVVDRQDLRAQFA